MTTAVKNTEDIPVAAKPARIKHPAYLLPGVMDALQSLGGAVAKSGLPPRTAELLSLRASQINGCSVCIDGHPRIARKLGETDERLFAVAAWRDAPYFTAAERAALALTEAATRMADHPESVTDAIWDEAADHYDEQGLSAIILMVALTNFFNRINVTVREPAGTTW